MKVLAISGSLQSRSSNSALIDTATAQHISDIDVQPFARIGELPHFNPDFDGDSPPESVLALRRVARDADAILIASPEYAHEMPGSLKNALDWLVPSGDLYGKPASLLCASPSAERGKFARDAVQRTLEAQGARVVLSNTVVMPRTTDGTVRVDAAVARVVVRALHALRCAAAE